MLVDAPCTSTGTIRRHPDVAWLRQEADIAALTALQKRLLQKAVALLKPGGTLVYCTCSLEPEEGEQAIAALLAAEPARAPRADRAPARSPGLPRSSPRRAICAPCPAICRTPTPGWAGWTAFTPPGWLNPDFAPEFPTASQLIRAAFKMVSLAGVSGLKGFATRSPPNQGTGVSVAQRRRISTLILGRFARNMIARASGGSVALSRLWPGRTDRLIIAPHDLRTADATRAAEIYAGRFVFAGKIVTCHGRSIFDLEPPSEDWEVALLGFGWLRHLRAADTAMTRANARSLVDDWISNPAQQAAAGAAAPTCWRAASSRCCRRRRWCSAIPTANSIAAICAG